MIRRYLIAGVAVLTICAIALPSAAQTIPPLVLIPIETIKKAPPTTHQLAVIQVNEANQGQTCELILTAPNQDSVHPGNNIVVASATEWTFKDVEPVAFGSYHGTGTIVLGPTLTVTLVLGPDKVFSAGMELVVLCDTTTTTTSPTTSSTVTTTTLATTTTQPPVTSSTAPTTTTAPSPTTLPSVPPTTPNTLPFTGISSNPITAGGIAVGLFLLAGLVWAVADSRRKE